MEKNTHENGDTDLNSLIDLIWSKKKKKREREREREREGEREREWFLNSHTNWLKDSVWE